MPFYDRSRTVEAAQRILDHRGWCIYEVCVDVAAQKWEPRVVIFARVAEEVADAFEAEIEAEPTHDARLSGCERYTLRPEKSMGAYVCYLADADVAASSPPPTPSERPAADPRPSGLVTDAMNPIVVTLEPAHTLREAARRMTKRSVGAAVVIGNDLPVPCLITERDILRSNGADEDIDAERVAAHLAPSPIHVCSNWTIERAVEAMLAAGSRHVVVLEGSVVVGILSMRDIVRCWSRDRVDRSSADAAGSSLG